MRNTWLAEQLATLAQNDEKKLIIDAAITYIESLEDDNESLQIALEGSIWSPKNWRDANE